MLSNLLTNTALLALISLSSSCQLLSKKTPVAHQSSLVVSSEKSIQTPKIKAVQPAKIDDHAPHIETDVWQRLRKNFSLNLDHIHPLVDKEINKFKKHPEYFTKVINRSRPYIHFIAEELEKRNMPAEIALLPIVESAFDPFAYSHGQASGMWQFIPSTGKEKGLTQNWWYDGRRDVTASTQAALDYLIWLTDFQNGDWLLGLASYNSGPGTVQKARRKNKKNGKPTDFWHLQLPTETEIYVPRLIALAKIFKEPHKYGITLTPVANEPYFSQVDTISQIDLSQAAKLAGITLDELYKLNPGYNRWATSPNGPHKLLIPISNAQQFEKNLAALPAKDRVKWIRHTVKSGDSVGHLAVKYNTTKNMIRESNQLLNDKIVIGKALMIPTASNDAKLYALSATQRLNNQQTHAPKKAKHKIRYQAEAGDSLWKIAHEHKVEVNQLARWNNMAPKDALRIGQQLVIWQQSDKPSGQVRKVFYKVKPGDNLSSIAYRFKVKTADIKKWNQIGRYLQPKQNLTLYVQVTDH